MSNYKGRSDMMLYLVAAVMIAALIAAFLYLG